MRRTLCCFCCFFSFIAYSMVDVNDTSKINLLLSSVDAAVENIHLKASMTITYSKEHHNQQEGTAKKILDSRRPEGFEYQMKLVDRDVEKKASLDITHANGKIRVKRTTHSKEGRDEVNVLHYDIGKQIDIYSMDTEEDQIVAEVKDRNVLPFFSITAYGFGRGFSHCLFDGDAFTKAMSKIDSDEGLYKLDVKSNQTPMSWEYLLDRNKGFCWRHVSHYINDAKSQEISASDFRNINGVWIPYCVDFIKLSDDGTRWDYKVNLLITECSIDPDLSETELNSFDDMPENVEIINLN